MSANDRWLRVRELFAKSLEQSDDTRDAWLRSQCSDNPELLAEVSHLLAQRSEPASIFRDDAQALLARMAADPGDDALIGTDVGPYRLRSLLGVGGMGQVYLADRTTGDFRQKVALKLIRSEFATTELRQRFLRERNTLARLAHPNIAQLHDGGVTPDGTPYFTLEYVEGEPITRWCDAHACDIRTRVNLMLKVCDAVLHAHRSLIVHRDLKPSNIMVSTDGEPKLLDFGIAKPLDETVASETLTHADARPMTREYAAPEQLLGDPVTTATDIYALGVLLYLLLSGHMPYRRAESGETTWIKAVLEDAPEPMQRAVGRVDADALAKSRATSIAALKRSLSGDLERIVQRALAKQAESRYPTVDKLADDLRAYLAGRAISGGTRTYRMRKFVRRHWLPLSASALLFLIVLASAIGLAWEAGQVEREAHSTAAVKDFLLNLFERANPDFSNGKMPTMRDAVDLGVKRLDAMPDSEADVRAEIEVELGVIYAQFGDMAKAQQLQENALRVLRVSAHDPIVAVRAARFEAVDYGALGDFNKAQALADEAYERMHRLRNPPASEIVKTLDVVHYVALHRSDLKRLKQLSDEALKAIDGVETTDEARAMAYAMAGDYARLTHDASKAVDYYLRAWPLKLSAQTRSTYGVELSSSLQDLGRYREARDYLEKTFAACTQAYGESSTRALRVGQMLAITEAYSGDVNKAAAHFDHLLDLARQAQPVAQDVVAEIELNEAEMLMALERYDAASEHVKVALDYGRSHPDGHASVQVESLSTLGYVEMSTAHLDEAAKQFEAALALAQAKNIHDTETIRGRLAYVRALLGDKESALSLAREANDDIVKSQGEASLDTAETHYFFGRVLEMAARMREAEAQYRASIASQAALLPPDGMHFFSADARFALANVIRSDPTKLDEARRLYSQTASLREETLGADNAHTREARQEVAKLAKAQ